MYMNKDNYGYIFNDITLNDGKLTKKSKNPWFIIYFV
jgi:hypothetical protein